MFNQGILEYFFAFAVALSFPFTMPRKDCPVPVQSIACLAALP